MAPVKKTTTPKVRKYASSKEAITKISNAINKGITKKYLRQFLNDSNNR